MNQNSNRNSFQLYKKIFKKVYIWKVNEKDYTLKMYRKRIKLQSNLKFRIYNKMNNARS